MSVGFDNPNAKKENPLKKMLFAAAVMLSAACSHAPKPDVADADPSWAPVPYREPAAECKAPGDWKECKNARKNDWADQYALDRGGNLFAYRDGLKCQVTNGVRDFKISQHKNDVAAIYYEKDGDLYILINQGDFRSRNCPSQNKKKLMADVDKFTVTSNTKTDVVNVALSKRGELVAWNDRDVVYRDTGVEDYLMNQCFGAEGKSFSSYVLFSIDRAGEVTKVKGEADYKYVAARSTGKRYGTIGNFKDSENVCQ